MNFMNVLSTEGFPPVSKTSLITQQLPVDGMFIFIIQGMF